MTLVARSTPPPLELGVAAAWAYRQRNVAGCTARWRQRDHPARHHCRRTPSRAAAAPSHRPRGHGQASRDSASAAADRDANRGRQERKIRRGPPEYHCADRRHFASDQSPGDRSAAAGKQRAAGQGAVAVSRGNAGLGRERRTACAQRARQHAIPHQRHHAARRRRRVRADPRHRHRRQPGAADRRAAGAIRPAHSGRAGHPDQGGRVQQFRQRQRLWRQPRHDHAELRIWRHGRADPIFRVRALSSEQSRNRKSDILERGHPRPHRRRKRDFSICRPCSIPPAA